MKKAMALILAVVFVFSFTACSTVKQSNKELKIRVYNNGTSLSKIVGEATAAFQKKHEDVEIISESIDAGNTEIEDYLKKLQTDIMAGKGPDLVFFDESLFEYCDVNKMMMSGAFAQLDEFLANDPDYISGDYNKNVMKAGEYNKKQYIMPIYYAVPCFVGMKSEIDKYGFDVSKCTDLMSMIDEAYRCAEENPSLDIKKIFRGTQLDNYFMYTGLNIIDYANNSVNIKTDEFKKAVDFYKAIYNTDKSSTEESVYGTTLVKNKDLMFNFTLSVRADIRELHSLDMCAYSREMINLVDKSVLLPMYDTNGKIQAQVSQAAAISKNSENKQNAYDFIKELINSSDGDANALANLPIKNSEVKNMVDKRADFNVALNIKYYPDAKRLTDDEVEEYVQLADKIDGAFFTTSYTSGLYEKMLPYYRGEKSFEECLKQAENYLQIYISE